MRPHTGIGIRLSEYQVNSFETLRIMSLMTIKKKGRPSAGGSHMSGVWERKKPRQAFPRTICGEAASNPRPGDSVRQLSPLHQACPSNEFNDNNLS